MYGADHDAVNGRTCGCGHGFGLGSGEGWAPCQWHHTAVHEGGVSISQGSQGWVFTKPDGRPWDWWVSDDNPAKASRFRALRHRQQARDQLAAVDSFQDPDARTIRPRWSSERFDLQASR
jgi:hypothetical protein